MHTFNINDLTRTLQHRNFSFRIYFSAFLSVVSLTLCAAQTTDYNIGGPIDSVCSIFSVENSTPIYDARTNSYIIPVANQATGTFSVNATLKSPLCSLTIGNVSISNQTKNITVPFGQDILCEASCPEMASPKTFTICLSNLPIVRITAENIGDNYLNGTLHITDPENLEGDTLHNMKIKWRGGSAKYFDKKAYAIKILDSEGEKKDVSFFGLREDNAWILDAASIDHSRIRNRVSTDLWNDFSSKPYYADDEPEALTGTRGHFVEIFINGEYRGLYCMTEKLDRKQLKLKKIKDSTVRGILFKAETWSTACWWGHDFTEYLPPANNSSATWEGWSMEYPNLDEDGYISWDLLYNFIKYLYNLPTNSTNIMANIGEYIDLATYRDWYLLVQLMAGTDNQAKNSYVYCYNSQKSTKLGFAPWDMEGTWGRKYNSDFISAEERMPDHEVVSGLFQRLSLDNAWTKSISERYAQLRQNSFQANSLKKRFQDYHNQLRLCGAERRETQLWGNVPFFQSTIHLDFDAEESYTEQWIDGRLKYLDNKFNYQETGISKVVSNENGTYYDLNGNKISNPSHGIYIVRYPNGTSRKVFVR